MDELAAEVGVDPLEIREKNWIKHEEFPFTTVAGLEYDSGNYEAATAKAKEMFGYDELRAEQKQRRDSGDTVQLGIGISTFTEMCGLAPSRVLGQLDYGAGGWEHASVRMLATGKVEVVTGASAHGQGHETAFSQIVADRLGVAFEDVEVLHGDTQVSHKGLDTYGSRSLVVGGEALVKAADKVIEKAKPIAAHLLEASVDDIEFSGGRFSVRGTDQGMAIGEIATAVFAAHNLPDGVEPSIDSEATYDPVNFNYPHGTHLCAMEVDTETGRGEDAQVRLRRRHRQHRQPADRRPARCTAAWCRASPRRCGRRRCTTTPARWCPARSSTTCCRPRPTRSASTSTTPRRRRPTNTLGTKGVGEAGTIASTPAVVNAVVDAVRHLGVNDIQMPCTPERVWKAINGPRLRRRDGGCGDAALRARAHAATRSTRRDRHGRSGRMIPAAFDYVAPTTVEEALAALAQHGDEAKIIAGGQSLLPVLRMRLNAPEWIIDLGKIESLRGIRDDGDAIVIGAMTPHVGGRLRPAGRRARGADHQGGRAPRRRPGAAPRHLRRRARARRPGRRPRGARRWRSAREFVIAGSGRHPHGRGRRLLRRPLRDRDRRGRDPHRGADPEAHRLGRALREVRPGRPPVADRRGRGDRARRGRHHRRGADRADQHGLTPLRARAVEEALAGQPATDDAVRAAAARAAEGTNPPSDLNGDADYRRHLAGVLTRRAVLAAAGA